MMMKVTSLSTYLTLNASAMMNKLMKIIFVGLLSGLYLLGCSSQERGDSLSDGSGVIPRSLMQSRNLDRNNYIITVALNNQNHDFDLVNQGGSYQLKLKGLIADGTYALAVLVQFPLGNQNASLYSYEGSLVVSGDDNVLVVNESDLTWPDDDSDGHSNFIELDQSSVDLDSDGTANYLDLDSDGDGVADSADATPFTGGTNTETPFDPVAEDMLPISAGCFTMGGSIASISDEGPLHEVCLTAFNLGKYEVTFEQYDTFTDATGRARVDDWGWGRANRPVVLISWDNANAYIAWLNTTTGKSYRLPSESEWEYAARAGSTTKYPWGDDVGNNRANCNGCGSQWDHTKTAPVGSFASNAWGLHDMHGNAWEWVEDFWHDSYDRAPTDGSAWNNNGTESHLLRGGSWNNTSEFLRSANRNQLLAEYYSNNRPSFRLAHD